MPNSPPFGLNRNNVVFQYECYRTSIKLIFVQGDGLKTKRVLPIELLKVKTSNVHSMSRVLSYLSWDVETQSFTKRLFIVNLTIVLRLVHNYS